MAAAQGIRAGRAFVELFADDSKLVRGLKAANSPELDRHLEAELQKLGDSFGSSQELSASSPDP